MEVSSVNSEFASGTPVHRAANKLLHVSDQQSFPMPVFTLHAYGRMEAGDESKGLGLFQSFWDVSRGNRSTPLLD